MHVVNLAEYRNRGVISALEELLALAKNGDIQAVVFVAKFGPHDHRAGATGDYKRHPEEAISATLIMKLKLVGLQPGTGTRV